MAKTRKRASPHANSRSQPERGKRKRPDRAPDGRFLPGHRLPGPGNPAVRQLAEMRRAVTGAVSHEDLVAVLKRLREMALDGDTIAARELFDRCIGKPRPAQDLVKFDLPELRGSEDVVKATGAVLQAVSEGRLGVDDAARIGGLLGLFRQAVEAEALAGIDARLARLEGGGRDGELLATAHTVANKDRPSEAPDEAAA